MNGSRGKVLRWRGERARLGTWRGRDHTAYLTPFPDSPPLSTAFIERCVGRLRDRGYESVVTGALTPGDALSFVDAGFRLHEELRLLEHDLTEIPAGPLPTRRARRRDRSRVVEIDASAFDRFWALDEDGIAEAIDATPWSRFRVVVVDRTVHGYAVSGRAGSRGYLQRLGVDPAARGRGVGRSLVSDALGWMQARGVRRALVNTHTDNEAALTLYESCGFHLLPTPLRILTRTT